MVRLSLKSNIPTQSDGVPVKSAFVRRCLFGYETYWRKPYAAEMLDGLMRKTLLTPQVFTYSPRGVVQRKSTELVIINDLVVFHGCEFIRINGGLSIRVTDVVKHLNLSKRSIELRFKSELGRSVLEEIQRVRLETIRRLVEQTQTPFARIAELCGFTCISHLGLLFKKEFGTTMTEYQERNS